MTGAQQVQAMDPTPPSEDTTDVAGLLAPTGYSDPGRGYVQVPVKMLKGETAETVLIVSLLARRLRSSSGGVVERVTQAHLAYELGWIERNSEASPVVANRISGWVRAAAKTSWLDVQYSYDTRRQRTMARYQLWGRPTKQNTVKYVVAPVELFDMVRDGVIDKHGFLAWLRWRAAMGSDSSTTKSVPEWAKQWGVSVATARRHRGALLKAGALTEVTSDGGASITALAPSLATSGETGGSNPPPFKNHEPPPSKSVNHPCQESGPSIPTGVPKDVSLLASAVADVQEVTRETATAASPSHKPESRDVSRGRRQASPSALAAAGRLLPRFRTDLLRCEAHYRRGIVRRTALFIDAGFGPEALVRAANELTVDVIDGNHNDAFRSALATLSVDVRLGACRGCGRDAHEFGHHPACEHAPVRWFEEVTRRECCVSCGTADGLRRDDLPIPVVVCDGCWTVHGESDPVAAAGEQDVVCDPSSAQSLDRQRGAVDEVRAEDPSGHEPSGASEGGEAGLRDARSSHADMRPPRLSWLVRDRRSGGRSPAKWLWGVPVVRCAHLRGPPNG